MKTPRIISVLSALTLGMALSGTAPGAFNTLEVWGNAVGTTPPASFISNATTTTITAGGADFWGGSDQGAFVWDNTGANTTSGDFTATVRHVSTTTPAPEWGREMIDVRATQSPGGPPQANDANWMACRKSNGTFTYGERNSVGGGTDADIDLVTADEQQGPTAAGPITQPIFMSAGREGSTLHAAFAMDLGGGVAGRWIQHFQRDDLPPLAETTEVIVGLGHQSHPQTISPDSNDINTGTFDHWTYAGTYSPTNFGVASGPSTWQLGGNVTVNTGSGAVTGAAFVQEGGVATGENVKWTVRVYKASSFVGNFDTAGSKKNPKAMEVADLVPSSSFRHANGATFDPGLIADIYLAGNLGNSSANLAYITNNQPPSGTTILPNIHWSNPTNGPGYPDNGAGGNLFEDAVALNSPGSFGPGVNQENFGVDHHGQIFIPADADRTTFGLPAEMLLFKDGVDDFCYLEIDGHVLINDNDWTGNSSADNGGGNLASMDVSDPKYNDGEWVPFRMVTWEGGGGDTASLYWHAFDTNGTFDINDVPGSAGSFVPTLGLAGSRKDPAAMEVADLVPPANFRQTDGVTPGLTADIYLHGNDGNFVALDAYVTNNPASGTTVLPRIHWSNPDNGPGYPSDGAGGNLFENAVPGSFGAGVNQENYGVNLTGQIFIPSDAARTTLNAPGGNNLVAFEDGVDDFCYLEVDGVPLINDNDWTGNSSVDNGGGNIALFDASAPKFDDGEWVPFRMMTWEGGGGDTASLYWSALDTNSSFQRGQLPGTSDPDFSATGTNQVGSDIATGVFLPSLPAGNWFVELTVENTGASLTRRAAATVGPTTAPPQITTFSYVAPTLNLTFTSQAGSNYALEYTIGFLPAGAPTTSAQKWNTVPGYASIPGAAGTTSIAPLNTNTLVTPGGQLPDNSQSYFRIRKL